MKLKTKILGVLLAVLLVYGILSCGIECFVVFPAFVIQERLEAEKDLNRCIEALRREIHYLDEFVHDWAAWDDAYEFIQNPNMDFIRSNLVQKTFTDNRLNVIMLLDLKGRILWKKILELETVSELKIPQFSDDRLSLSHVFMAHTQDIESSVAGVYATDKGPLLVSSRPIIRSLHQGPAKGYLIMGRFLDKAYMKTLTAQTKVDHQYWLFQDPALPADSRAMVEKLLNNAGPIFEEQDKKRLFVYDIFKGLTDSSDIIIRVELPRQIMKYAKNTMFFVLISTCLAGVALLLVMYFLLNRVVIDPLGKLTARVVSLGDATPVMPLLCLNRNDEIGILCSEFQALFDKLTRVHENLQRTNTRLNHEIRERKSYEEKLQSQRTRLRHLTYKLLLTEETERRRLASDLHDQISQKLAICQLKLAMLKDFRATDNTGGVRKIEELEDILEEIIQETRTLTFEISPPVLYELGLKPALEWLFENTCMQSGIDIRLEGDLDGQRLDNSLNILIFRTVRELLHNIIKHAKATKTTVRFSDGTNFLEICVTDNGIGFDSEMQYKNMGFGLFSIRERFRSIGGEFTVQSETGAGTRAILKVPYNVKDSL
ncbi:CHASE4 domain-containing protein [uncultured Desulfobacter sp.]|uniref:sensor histidine kinase n=1 Tax=uncultured Desulfobacter sp. TaxID=240139 RepID=UPI002AAADF17|nr:CHASE4 domain-containing protein [uncultured Desulfobacter sp.]